MKFLKGKNISINSYKDLEHYANCTLNALRLVDYIFYHSFLKDDKSLEQEEKCQCKEKTEEIEEKENEIFSLTLKIKNSIYFSFSWTKTEEKSIEQINEVIEKEDQIKILETIKNLDLNQFSSYESLILIIIELLKQWDIHKCRGIRNAINWLSNIIPFNELEEIVKCTFRVFSGSLSGITHIIQGIRNFPNNKIASAVNLTTGVIEIAKAGFDVFETAKKIEIENTKKNSQKLKIILIN